MSSGPIVLNRSSSLTLDIRLARVSTLRRFSIAWMVDLEGHSQQLKQKKEWHGNSTELFLQALC